jgi:hypothetical protein
MMIKRAALAVLCSIMMTMTGASIRARQDAFGRTPTAQTRKPQRRVRVGKSAPPATPQIILPAKDEYTQKRTLRGLIISTEGGSFTLRDERGLDTVVLLFPDTLYKIKKASGSTLKVDPSVIIRRGTRVTVKGLLDSSYRMKAIAIIHLAGSR